MKINGSLVFDASSASEIQNLRIQKYEGASVPAWTSADAGRLIYVTVTGGGYTAGTVYQGSGSAWVAVGTGGDVAGLQTEVDAVETSLGAGVNSSGVFQAGAFNSPISSATSFTNAINQLADYAAANNTLAELDDVTITAAATGDFLRYNGSAWVDHVLVLADVSDVTTSAAELNLIDGLTAAAAELNILDGATLSTTELNYVTGVTSSIQTQLNNKQPLDAGLTALAAFDTNGILVQTATDTFAGRTLTAPAAGLTITNPAGIAGNPTFALANDLAALEDLATTGYIVRTGDGTATTRSIAGQSGRIVVTNGDGVSSNTDVDLATVTDAGTGTFLKITRDSYGRVSGTTAVVAGDITGLVDATYVNVAGDTMSGNLTMSGGATVTGLPAPTNSTDAANKAYVDAVAEGLHVHAPTKAVSASNQTATYDNGTAGVGATLTFGGAVTTLDGYTLVNGDRIMVIGQTNTFENGIYVRTSGTVWTRASDFDTTTEVAGGDFVFNQEGTTYANTGFVQTETTTAIGTDPILFLQFSGAGSYTAGTGLVLTGTTFSVNLGAGIVELPSDEVGIDLYSPTAGAIILTDDGSARATTGSAKLHLLLPAGSGLTQDATGLYIGANAITNAMILNDSHGLNGDSGTGSLDLGQTLTLTGNATQGIVTSASGQTLNVTASDASTTQKGVASFDSSNFDVTSGAVSIKAGGIDLTTEVTGVLPVANGGTGLSSLTAGYIPYGNGTSAFSSEADLSYDASVNRLLVNGSTNGVYLGRIGIGTIAGLSTPASKDLYMVPGSAGGTTGSTNVVVNTTGSIIAGTSQALKLQSAVNIQLTSTGSTTGNGVNIALDTGTAAKVSITGPSAANYATSLAANDLTNKQYVDDAIDTAVSATYYLHTQGSSSTTWTVTHNLGQRYCNVTVVDASDEMVIPASITFDSTTQLTVTFNTAITGKVVVMGVA